MYRLTAPTQNIDLTGSLTDIRRDLVVTHASDKQIDAAPRQITPALLQAFAAQLLGIAHAEITLTECSLDTNPEDWDGVDITLIDAAHGWSFTVEDDLGEYDLDDNLSLAQHIDDTICGADHLEHCAGYGIDDFSVTDRDKDGEPTFIEVTLSGFFYPDERSESTNDDPGSEEQVFYVTITAEREE